MTTLRRQVVLTGILLILLTGIAAWSCRAMGQAKASMLAMSEDLVRCQQLAGDITHLRQQPQLAGDQEIAFNDLTRQIEEAAKKNHIPANAIVRISPEPARRVGQSAYQEKPTRIELRQVTLKQLLNVMYEVTADSPSLRIRSIRLSLPHTGDDDQTWDIEFTLSHLKYQVDKAH